LSLDLPVARRRFRDEGVEKFLGNARVVVHGTLESGVIDFGRFVEATELAHELKRRCLDLLFRRRWLEIEERFDISTLAALSSKNGFAEKFLSYVGDGVMKRFVRISCTETQLAFRFAAV